MKVLMCLRMTSLHCYKKKHLHQVQYDYRVATGQEMVEKKILQGQEKAREFYFESGKIDVLKKFQGKWKKIKHSWFHIIEGWNKLNYGVTAVSTIFFLNEEGKCVEIILVPSYKIFCFVFIWSEKLYFHQEKVREFLKVLSVATTMK